MKPLFKTTERMKNELQFIKLILFASKRPFLIKSMSEQRMSTDSLTLVTNLQVFYTCRITSYCIYFTIVIQIRNNVKIVLTFSHFFIIKNLSYCEKRRLTNHKKCDNIFTVNIIKSLKKEGNPPLWTFRELQSPAENCGRFGSFAHRLLSALNLRRRSALKALMRYILFLNV